MTMQQPAHHHLAQMNIGRIRYDIDDPRMADFTNNLALVNGIAERSAGFIWRYVDESGNATETVRRFGSTTCIVKVRPDLRLSTKSRWAGPAATHAFARHQLNERWSGSFWSTVKVIPDRKYIPGGSSI